MEEMEERIAALESRQHLTDCKLEKFVQSFGDYSKKTEELEARCNAEKRIVQKLMEGFLDEIELLKYSG